MIVKTNEEIKIMEQGGIIASLVMKKVLANVVPGVSLLELDAIAEAEMLKHNALPSFKTVPDYFFSTCINLNEGIVHGLPDKKLVKAGDLVSVDLGVLFNGLHTDMSYTVEVETNKYARFLDAGKKALNDSIKMCKVGNRIGDISNVIQTVVESYGYTVSEELVGHGVGRELHEDPYVPGIGKKGKGPIIKNGATLAIEVIYQMGKPDIVLAKDGWTLETKDKSMAGLFEQTVAITAGGYKVLTDFNF